ncbi:hypothetical protein ACO0KY_19520 [Undibacterium sp. Dicai25W]|uniref:hypothetical protein n=1 Tax=Undibacterium sp. Dicai25W TaxID=3413034 RepID=UPI003BF384D8
METKKTIAKAKPFQGLLTTDMIWCMELDELKGKLWIAYLLETGKFKSIADMHKVLGVVESVQSWSQYKAGISPQDSTIKVVDKLIAGSGSFWWVGPGGLPLWSVLDGNMAVCSQVIAGLFNNYRGNKPWMLISRKEFSAMGDADKVKGLLEIVLPESLWLPANTRDAEFVHPLLPAPTGNTLKGWLSLSELFTRTENALSVGYLQDRLKSKEQGVIRSFVAMIKNENLSADKNHDLTNKHYVLSFIALINICNDSKDKMLSPAPDFLKLGVYQSVVDAFGIGVAEFVKEM